MLTATVNLICECACTYINARMCEEMGTSTIEPSPLLAYYRNRSIYDDGSVTAFRLTPVLSSTYFFKSEDTRVSYSHTDLVETYAIDLQNHVECRPQD
eukprot:SAG11_NODE_2444_length_3354_cov_2.476498_1_plen_98_part_00